MPKKRSGGCVADDVAKKPKTSHVANPQDAAVSAEIKVMYKKFANWTWLNNSHKHTGILIVLLIALDVMEEDAFLEFFQPFLNYREDYFTSMMIEKPWWKGRAKQMSIERLNALIAFALLLFSDTKINQSDFLRHWSGRANIFAVQEDTIKVIYDMVIKLSDFSKPRYKVWGFQDLKDSTTNAPSKSFHENEAKKLHDLVRVPATPGAMDAATAGLWKNIGEVTEYCLGDIWPSTKPVPVASGIAQPVHARASSGTVQLVHAAPSSGTVQLVHAASGGASSGIPILPAPAQASAPSVAVNASPGVWENTTIAVRDSGYTRGLVVFLMGVIGLVWNLLSSLIKQVRVMVFGKSDGTLIQDPNQDPSAFICRSMIVRTVCHYVTIVHFWTFYNLSFSADTPHPLVFECKWILSSCVVTVLTLTYGEGNKIVNAKTTGEFVHAFVSQNYLYTFCFMGLSIPHIKPILVTLITTPLDLTVPMNFTVIVHAFLVFGWVQDVCKNFDDQYAILAHGAFEDLFNKYSFTHSCLYEIGWLSHITLFYRTMWWFACTFSYWIQIQDYEISEKKHRQSVIDKGQEETLKLVKFNITSNDLLVVSWFCMYFACTTWCTNDIRYGKSWNDIASLLLICNKRYLMLTQVANFYGKVVKMCMHYVSKA